MYGLRYRGGLAKSQPVSLEILAPLRAPITSLPGLGPRLSVLVGKLVGGERVRDVLFHLPVEFVDRRGVTTIRDAKPGVVATLRIEVIRHEAPGRKGQPHRVVIGDGTAFAEIVLFHAARLVQFPVGAKLLVSGKVEVFSDRITLPHPDFVLNQAQEAGFPWIEPVWPLAAGVVPRVMRRAALGALERLPALPEWLSASVLRHRHWPGFKAAMAALHAPVEIPDEKPGERLAYDELLARQIAFALVRARRRKRAGRVLLGDGKLRRAALQRFGFTPTAGQIKALAEIDQDMASPHQMLRLLQGDVGSGKTLVAVLAMLRAVEAGAQAALLAPTEILAKQHYEVLQKLSPVPVVFLSGNVKGKARKAALDGIADGSVPMVVGTHAIFQKSVAFHDLALAVIDEQHRFGVDQRLALSAKGEMTDLLVMTATPIPRTLLLTHWGEMDVSRITEKPAGRKPITTTMHKLADLEKVLDAIERAVGHGGRVYWVCPLVTESEVLDVTATEIRYAALQARFGAQVGMAHGQMEPAQRDAALAEFAAGTKTILVATTVIEVGVDVRQANVMVIEHAERFGLAQLHQLRGRVGRGEAQSYCLLLHADKLGVASRQRLSLLRETEDGFVIADEDHRLRGAGDALGTKQSGLPGYRLADAEKHEGLLPMARQDAVMLLETDPKLETPRGQAVRVLLNLFDQRDAINTLRAG
ncbi:MAG: ATP-dependent DNA helicase RecG [Acidocella sp. 20-57-95]|nr:MAG: ATP-dependent DNA helicase RecG [Acidocella sp. 20-57-95]OYV61735.1 MAG: ATP-dependent DNA helicase RecG [Acidocella sp. 21-58-7]HQT65201.1 ATP-dependent DNA helicase RecG [Acidocella sp.]HQU05054.1 ATP-dependent DNA helicase RecG [Acidocella sp.]